MEGLDLEALDRVQWPDGFIMVGGTVFRSAENRNYEKVMLDFGRTDLSRLCFLHK